MVLRDRPHVGGRRASPGKISMESNTGADTATASDGRLPLSRERVLRAAIELADTGGIEALTMRRLGQALGVEAMSLYNHVTNKEDVISGILELAVREIALPSSDGDWKAELRASAISSYEVLRRHRWAASLLMSPSAASPTRIQWMEAVLRTLRYGGFSAVATCHAFHAIDSHITGYTLWQQNIPFTKAELAEVGAAFLQRFPIDVYPYVGEHIHQHINDTSHDGRRQFEFGLDLILDGLERTRDGT
jgi:AcrR family transcriptional regulator